MKEQSPDQRGFMEKAGTLDRHVGLVVLALGALISSTALMLGGTINFIEGTEIERYFRNRRIRKTVKRSQ